MKQTRLLSVVVALVLFGGFSQTFFAQIPCGINSVGISPSDLTMCEVQLPVDFTANIDSETDPIPLPVPSPMTNNFQAPFTHTYSTEDNGCTYALRITGSYSIWSNPDKLVDARYEFDPITNDELTQKDPVGLNITTPDSFSPDTYNPDHEYWFFYEGDGEAVNIDFEDTGQYTDNAGDMTFDWFVLPCYETTWSIDGSTPLPGDDTRTLSWQTPGTFSVIVQVNDVLAGCSDMATAQINISIRPEATVTTTDACGDGETGTATTEITAGTGTSPLQFNWSNGNPDAAFAENLMPGNYQVTIVDANNCRDTVDFSIIQKTAPSLMIEAFDPTCAGLEDGRLELLNGEPTWTYSLDGIDYQFTSLFQSLGVGDYTFFVNDNDGCVFEEPTTLTAPTTFQVELPAEIVVNEGETFTLSPTITGGDGNFKFGWLPFEDLSCPDCENPTGTLSASQAFTVTVFDGDGCSNEATVFVRVVIPEPAPEDGIFIPTAFSPNNDGINDFLTIFVDRNIIAQVANLSVFDRYGGLMFQRENFEPNEESLGWNGEFAGKVLDSGVYAWFAELERADGSMTIVKGEVSLVR